MSTPMSIFPDTSHLLQCMSSPPCHLLRVPASQASFHQLSSSVLSPVMCITHSSLTCTAQYRSGRGCEPIFVKWRDIVFILFSQDCFDILEWLWFNKAFETFCSKIKSWQPLWLWPGRQWRHWRWRSLCWRKRTQKSLRRCRKQKRLTYRDAKRYG